MDVFRAGRWLVPVAAALLLTAGLSGRTQAPTSAPGAGGAASPAPREAPPGRAVQAPEASAVRFHHVHMNVVDPGASTAFYVTSFGHATRHVEAGIPGVKSDDVLVLFNRVAQPASAEWDTPFWHFGWNTADAVADYRRLSAQGVRFFRVPPPSGHMVGPDGNDVEIAPGKGGPSGGVSSSSFNHVHLMSAAPLCAATWYERVLGLQMGRVTNPDGGTDCHVPFRPRHDPANQIHEPNAGVFAGSILIAIYPQQRLKALTQTAVDDQGPLVSPKGRVLDHIGLSVADLPGTLARLRREGVVVLEGPAAFGNGALRSAMIEGPDRMRIELVERGR